MSTKPIWSLNARRSELGGATKGQIYLSKIGIGFASAVPLWFAHGGNLSAVLVSCLAVFVTSKVCWHVNTNDWTIGWDSLADWLCDCWLHCWWYWLYSLSIGHYTGCAITAGMWIASYPWSSE